MTRRSLVIRPTTWGALALVFVLLPAARAQEVPAALSLAGSASSLYPPPAGPDPSILPPPQTLPSPLLLPSPPVSIQVPPATAPPGDKAPAPAGEEPPPIDPLRIHPVWYPEVWGVTGLTLVASGERTAPNGQVYDPLGSLNLDLNIGLLPQKKLYIFGLGTFWAQKPTSSATNPTQGNFDFSKREFDFTLGAAWNYWGPLEARVFAYSYNNLNRGLSEVTPLQFNDGVGLENRWYLSGTNIYDLPRLNFLSFGFYPSQDMIGADGVTFHPGLFLRAYLTYEFVPLHYYLYTDTQMIAQTFASPRLLLFDDGFAARPFTRFNGVEFRLGVTNTVDVGVDDVRTLIYGTVQVLF
jgi:hypothetical protein